MSHFIDKLQFWKKQDDYSFNDSSDPFASSSPSSSPSPSANTTTDYSSGLPPLDASANDPSALPQDSFGAPSESSSFDPLSGSSQTADPFASSAPPSSHSSSPSSSPVDSFMPARGSPQTPPLGKQLAQDYIEKTDSLQPSWSGQVSSSSPSSQQAPQSKDQSMELLQLKIDAIRSELNAMSQRMIKIEHLLEDQKKKRSW